MLVFGGVPILGEIIQFDYLPGVSITYPRGPSPARRRLHEIRLDSVLFLRGERKFILQSYSPDKEGMGHLKRDHFERKTPLNIYFTYIIYKNHQFSGYIPYFSAGLHHFALGISSIVASLSSSESNHALGGIPARRRAKKDSAKISVTFAAFGKVDDSLISG